MLKIETLQAKVRDFITGVRRYHSIRKQTVDHQDPDIEKLKTEFQPLIESVQDDIESFKYIRLESKNIPWTTTNISVCSGQEVSVLATGRLWRSRIRDLWIAPQLGLWCRLGENGIVFNSTRNTNTFTAQSSGNLYLATQFPGQFADPTGRIQPPLQVYNKAEGGFSVLVIVWKGRSNPSLQKMIAKKDPFGLLSMELDRQANVIEKPKEWKHLWFVGVSDIFSEEICKDEKCIHCRTKGNVGLLQKDVVHTLTPNTELHWDWIVAELPSRLREDTSASHDYLSIAVEFENGRDITYYWSYELPKDYGYWCPLPTWYDREFHIVVRSGLNQIDHWLNEKRNLYEDYRKYIGSPPQKIVRIWLIAGSRWQRIKGEMTVKSIKLVSSGEVTIVI